MSEQQLERQVDRPQPQERPVQQSTPGAPGGVAARRQMADKLSPFLRSQIGAVGVAAAVVVLRDGGLAASALESLAVADDLNDAFVHDDRAPSRMMMRSAGRRRKHTMGFKRAGVVRVEGSGLAAAAGESRALMYPELGVMIGDVHAEGAARLAGDERVEYVASAVAFSLVRPENRVPVSRPGTTTTWGIGALEIPRLWDAGLDGHGVLVGHLDTGADSTHPALSGAIQHFLFVDEAGFPGAAAVAYDTGYHGTHTAATIAGREVAGRSVGVAPGAGLAVATVIEHGDAAKRIITALNWVVRLGAKVVNLSLGFRGYVDDLYIIMQRVRDRGVLPVVASGNEGAGTSRSPGNYESALSVGACDENRTIWRSSSSQIFARPNDPIVPNIVGPGVGVISAAPGGRWWSNDGTSMATPHVSGLAALLWQAKPNASVDQIEAAIVGSASLGSMIQERAGYGMPNGPAAYELLMGQPLPAAIRAKARPRRKAVEAVVRHNRRPAAKKKSPAKKKVSKRTPRDE